MTETFNFQYERAYKASSSWKTLIDEVYSGGEQRRNQWSEPRKKWVLQFNVNAANAEDILDFFDARRGRYEAFYWQWQAVHPVKGTNMGGDGETYTVRFDDDTLNFEHLFYGNKTFQITLVEVN